MKPFILGTRGSDLALWQARYIAQLLLERTGTATELKIIQAESDLSPETPITPETWPAGGFTSALEQALLTGEIDLAVHSLKDLPTQSPPELVIAAMPVRAAVEDWIVSRSAEIARHVHAALQGQFPDQPIRLGTSSPRRACQARQFLSLVPEPIRGNVPTRIAKVQSGQYDAVSLAAAGVHRLGLQLHHVVALPLERFPTAPGQGALAVQCRADAVCRTALAALDHAPTRLCVEAERSFLHMLKAGCHAPAAAAARLVDSQIQLHVQFFLKAGGLFERTVAGREPVTLGIEAARQALAAEATA